MNSDIYSSAGRQLALALLFFPTAALLAALVQKNPPVRPEDANSPVLIWDIDLKLDKSLPRNFRTTDDWSNVGRTHDEIEADEAARVKSLKAGSKIVVNPGAAIKKPGATSSAPENVTVEHASTEHDIVVGNNAAYVRLTVTDHARPLDEEVDRFILAVRIMPKNGWAHFHCEAGRGRTTTFLVLYDMMRNANRVSLEDIARRQQLLGYDYDVLRPADPGSWKAPYTEDRIAFVRAFYSYARTNPNGRP